MRITHILRNIKFHTVENLFQPIITSPVKEEIKDDKITSLSQKMMIKTGIIHQAHNGLFHILPLGLRALEKLTALVDNYMGKLSAQKIMIPSLTDGNLWQKTGRLETAGPELFRVADRHDKLFVLAPTHEESVANLLATVPLVSHRNLPILLYQISNKYRDEMRPRYGLIRSKEFLMKDLYSFDKSIETASETYERVCQIYHELLNHIGIDYIKVAASTGVMGGERSHEFHYRADIGDDILLSCDNCNYSWNKELQPESNTCTKCSSNRLTETKGIEVANTFLLGTKYSHTLASKYSSSTTQKPVDLVMGSYGIGLTRLLAAALEVLSTSTGLRWPSALAPYSVLIITPKEGSKEAAVTEGFGNELYLNLQNVKHLNDEVLLDNRDRLTIGRRLAEAKLTGYPYIVVIGKSSVQHPPLYELHSLNDNSKLELTFSDLFQYLSDGKPPITQAVASSS